MVNRGDAAKQMAFFAVVGVGMVLFAGGLPFLSRPLGAAFITLWLLWGVVLGSGRGVGRASIHEQRQHRVVVLQGALCFALMMLAPWEYVTFGGPLPREGPLPLVGVLLFAAGVALQWLALRELGSFYTSRLGIQEGHRMVTSGPYSLVRHPGYLSSLATVAGMALSMGSLLTIGATVLSVIVVVWRIRGEEEMLVEAFGDEYRAYQRKTRRLIPHVY